MILIVQNGYLNTKISKYLEEDYFIVKSYSDNIDEIDLTTYSVIIILGGHQSVRDIDRYPYLNKVIKLINLSIDKNIPLIGICLGCQLIAHALGYDICTCDQLNLGYDTKIFGIDNIFRCHKDYANIDNDQVNILETHNNMPYVFTYKNLLGIQCHPDIPPEYVNIYHPDYSTKLYAAKYSKEIDLSNKFLIKKLFEILNVTFG